MNIDDLTRQIIGCSFKIHRVLGAGFFREHLRERTSY